MTYTLEVRVDGDEVERKEYTQKIDAQMRVLKFVKRMEEQGGSLNYVKRCKIGDKWLGWKATGEVVAVLLTTSDDEVVEDTDKCIIIQEVA